METITITINDLRDILYEFDEENCESRPFNVIWFCNKIFDKYMVNHGDSPTSSTT